MIRGADGKGRSEMVEVRSGAVALACVGALAALPSSASGAPARASQA